MDLAAEEGAGCDDDVGGLDEFSGFEGDALDPAVVAFGVDVEAGGGLVDDDVRDTALED